MVYVVRLSSRIILSLQIHLRTMYQVYPLSRAEVVEMSVVSLLHSHHKGIMPRTEEKIAMKRGEEQARGEARFRGACAGKEQECLLNTVDHEGTTLPDGGCTRVYRGRER